MMELVDGSAFEEHRPLLLSIAYRMLGSIADAEDVVQEAYLRWSGAEQHEVQSARAYLTAVVTRLCLDQLKSARVRRESYVGPWLPEPVRAIERDPVGDAESISLAFLVLLESLSPVERAVYLLHEAFDYGHAEIASILGQKEPYVRQILHRAREHVRARRPRFAPSREAHERLLGRFAQAVLGGDVDGLRAMLATDATAWSDGGGKTFAARKPVHGGDAVARFIVGVAKKGLGLPHGAAVAVELVNGWPAVVARLDGRAVNVLALETDGETIFAVRFILNPEKLARL